MIAVIDYGAGNTASVVNALKKLDCQYCISFDIQEIDLADKIILPGVGEASFAMNELKKRGLVNYLKETRKPLLGICLGMHLLCTFSEEGNTEGLNIFPYEVLKFDKSESKVPHIGWNTVEYKEHNILFDGIKQNEFFYFANSYYVPVNGLTGSVTENNSFLFSSSLINKNFYGVQFHPEKSSASGMLLLKNFIEKIKESKCF